MLLFEVVLVPRVCACVCDEGMRGLFRIRGNWKCRNSLQQGVWLEANRWKRISNSSGDSGVKNVGWLNVLKCKPWR